jgi:murein DD-endopeptidase MepM/ murein hydrolase activator NlpD
MFRNNFRVWSRVQTGFIILIVSFALISVGFNGQMTQAMDNSPTLAPIATNTPRLAATNSPVPSPTLTVTPANVFVATPAPGPLGGSDSATWTPAALTLLPGPHFWLNRPIGPSGVNYIAHNYAYGGTDGGGRPIHHGDDFENPYGTAVLAAGDGVVQYAGDDIHQIFGPQPNFYGNVIVIRHPFADSNGQAVFSLYGHLSQIGVQTGQTVKVGQVIGLVGSAGVAIGAHLHFEVRVGDPNNYNSTRNPELWIAPFSASGAVAGRVSNLYGQPVGTIQIQFQRQDSFYAAENYADGSTPGDTQWQETFALNDLQSGYYTVFIRSKGGATLYRNTVLIITGQVTWLGDIHIAQP